MNNCSTVKWFSPFGTQHVEWYYITDTWTEDNRDAYFFFRANDQRQFQ